MIAAISRANPGLNTVAHGFWADFKLWDNAPADLLANGNCAARFHAVRSGTHAGALAVRARLFDTPGQRGQPGLRR